jgi:hypothetical protein
VSRVHKVMPGDENMAPSPLIRIFPGAHRRVLITRLQVITWSLNRLIARSAPSTAFSTLSLDWLSVNRGSRHPFAAATMCNGGHGRMEPQAHRPFEKMGRSE